MAPGLHTSTSARFYVLAVVPTEQKARKRRFAGGVKNVAQTSKVLRAKRSIETVIYDT